MPRAWCKTYASLILKKDHPKFFFSNFHPISLCNVCYKIVSKIMGNHLKDVLDNLISRQYSGFIPSHTLLDNIIDVQEIIPSTNQDRTKPTRMFIKVDFERAYDTLNWNAILATLARMNFPNTWIS